MLIKRTHDDCINVMKVYLKERNLKFIDLEDGKNDDFAHPDLLLPNEKLVLEIKTIQPSPEERQNHLAIEKNLRAGGLVSYWHPEKYNSISDDIANCRNKFRNYAGYKTAIVIFDLMPSHFKQVSQELFDGQEQIIIKTFSTPDNKIHHKVSSVRKINKPIHRQDTSNIGAILWHYDYNAFYVYHNNFADKVRRIESGLFSENDIHYLVSENGINKFNKPD